MQQSEFQQIREWYQQFEDAVPFLPHGRHAALAEPRRHLAAGSGRRIPATVCPGRHAGDRHVFRRQGSVLYLLRQKQCRIGGTPVILVQICAQPEEELFWSRPRRCHEEETGSPPYARRYLASPTPSVRCIRIWMNPATRSPG